MVFCLNNKVDRGKYYGDPEPLSLSDIQELEVYDNAWYWYVNGGYDGTGELIIENNGKWYYRSISHCSCNSPLDDIEYEIRTAHGADSIDALISPFTQELQRDTKILIDAIKGITEPNSNPCNDGF